MSEKGIIPAAPISEGEVIHPFSDYQIKDLIEMTPQELAKTISQPTDLRWPLPETFIDFVSQYDFSEQDIRLALEMANENSARPIMPVPDEGDKRTHRKRLVSRDSLVRVEDIIGRPLSAEEITLYNAIRALHGLAYVARDNDRPKDALKALEGVLLAVPSLTQAFVDSVQIDTTEKYKNDLAKVELLMAIIHNKNKQLIDLIENSSFMQALRTIGNVFESFKDEEDEFTPRTPDGRFDVRAVLQNISTVRQEGLAWSDRGKIWEALCDKNQAREDAADALPSQQHAALPAPASARKNIATRLISCFMRRREI